MSIPEVAHMCILWRKRLSRPPLPQRANHAEQNYQRWAQAVNRNPCSPITNACVRHYPTRIELVMKPDQSPRAQRELDGGHSAPNATRMVSIARSHSPAKVTK